MGQTNGRTQDRYITLIAGGGQGNNKTGLCIDAYSVKHITYKWQDGPTKSVSLADEVQLPQVQVKGYRVKDKLEVLSTGVCRLSFDGESLVF